MNITSETVDIYRLMVIVPVFKYEVLLLMRPTIDEYFMEIASIVAKRSTCLRNQVGAVIVKDKRIYPPPIAELVMQKPFVIV